MSIFDAERQQLGIPTGSQASSSEAPTQSKSIFDDERAKLFAPTQTDQQPQPNFQQDMMQRQNFVDVNQSPLMQKIQQTQPMQGPPAPQSNDERTDYPGGWVNPLNILGHIANSPILNSLDYAAGNAMGVPDNLMTAKPETTGSNLADKAIGLIGGTAGYLTNPAQLEMNVGKSFFENPFVQGAGNKASGAVNNALSKLTGADVSNTLESKLLSGAAKGVAVGGLGAATYAPFQTLIGGGNEQDIPRNILGQGLQGAELGGLFGGSGPVVGAGLSKLADKYAGSKIGDAIGQFFSRSASEPPPAEPLLGLPRPGETAGSKPLMLREGPAASGDVIHAPGQVYQPPVLGLPEPNILPPTTARRMTIANPYQQKFENLMQTAQQMQFTPGKELEELESLWSQMADKEDPNLNGLIDLAYPKTREVSPDMLSNARSSQQLRDVYGVPSPVRSAGDRYQPYVGEAAAPRQIFQRLKTNVGDGTKATPSNAIAETPALRTSVASRAEQPVSAVGTFAGGKAASSEIKPAQRALNGTAEREFGTLASLKESPKTGPQLISAIGERSDGTYTAKTNETTVNNANKILGKKGPDEAKAYLINKKTMLKSDDVTLGYRLIDEYQKSGDYDSAADVALKLMHSNLESGRSIQANAIYNRLTSEGALRVATKVYNNGVDSLEAHRAIPAQVAEDIKKATVKMREASGNTKLSQDVIGILDKAKRGEALTEEENSQLKRFANEAKKYIAEEPKRKRDKLIEYTSKQADAARRRLAAQRNIGFAATTHTNPIVDMAIIGVDHMVKGAVKFADFVEEMAHDVSKATNMDKVYVESWKRYQRLNNLKMSDFEKMVNQSINTRDITGAKSDVLRRMAIELSQLEGAAHKEAIGELQQAFNALKEGTVGEKAASVLRSVQLGNPRTMIRNEVSNQLFYALDTLRRKFIATPIDVVASMKNGDRQVFFKNNPNSWKQYFTDWKDQYKAWKKGVNLGGLETQYDLGTLAFNPQSTKLTARVGSFLERQIGAFMKASDYAAANRAINTDLYQMARAKAYAEGLRGKFLERKAESYFYQADETMSESARQYGEYMTFQDKNFLSDAAMKVKDTLNLGKDFGLGNIFFNYPKTPSNIFMRAMDYSPAGYLRFLKRISYDVFRKGATKKDIIDSFSRATAGTAMGAIGAYLASIGLINVLPSKDKNVNSLERSAGIVANSINVNGLIRFITSFGDPEAAKPRQGDTYSSVDWLQPMAITGSAGAAIAQSQSASRLKRGVNAAGAVLQAIDAATQSATNMSMYKNIKGLLPQNGETLASQSYLGRQLSQIPAAFVPSALNQTRNTVDPYYRDTSDPNLGMQIVKTVGNKLPGVSESLPKRYDTLGKEMQNDYGPISRAFNSFINPSLVDKYQPSEGAQVVLDLINRTGQTTAAPNAPSKTFTYKKQTYRFSPDEYRTFQQQVGASVEQGITKSLPYLQSQSVPDEGKLKRLDKIMSDSLDHAKLDYRKLKGIR